MTKEEYDRFMASLERREREDADLRRKLNYERYLIKEADDEDKSEA